MYTIWCGPKPQVYKDTVRQEKQDLRVYLPGTGLGPVLSLESTGFEHPRPAELTFYCTPSNLTSTTPPLKGPHWRKELSHPELKCASTRPTPRAAALLSGLRDVAVPCAPGRPHGGPPPAALAPLATSPPLTRNPCRLVTPTCLRTPALRLVLEWTGHKLGPPLLWPGRGHT